MAVLVLPLVVPLTIETAQANPVTAITVTGGTTTADHDGYRYHVFTHTEGPGTSSQDELVVAGGSVPAEVLLVAGGGGGGRNRAGGGGAGEVREISPTLDAGQITVQVGGGGKGGFPAEARSPDTTGWNAQHFSPGCSGVDSTFDSHTVKGGGGAGAKPTPSNEESTVKRFDCEGDVPYTETIASFTDNRPFVGEDGQPGGSGGGAGYVGGSGGPSTASDGGLGSSGGSAQASAGGFGGGASGDSREGTAQFSIYGIATNTGEIVNGVSWFGGGGSGFRGGDGGKGGGATSASALGTPGNRDYSILDGLPSTGGGGAGCANAEVGCRGGHGGSGVVIVRYAVPMFTDLTEPYGVDEVLARNIDFGSGVEDIGVTGADSVAIASGNLPPGITLSGLNSSTNAAEFSGLTTQVGTFSFTLRAYKSDPSAGPTVVSDRPVTITVAPVAPGAPEITGVSNQGDDALIAITPPANTGGEAPTYQGTIDGGSTWTELVADGADWVWSGFDASAQQLLQVRATNSAGSSPASDGFTYPLLMLNNGIFRAGGGNHDSNTFTPVASIEANGQMAQPFYYDSTLSRWAKMTYGEAPFDFAVGFGEGNEPDDGLPYDPSRNWTGSTVYGTFQNPSPFDTPVPGSLEVRGDGFSCSYSLSEPEVCIGTGTLVSTADFLLDGRLVGIENRYTLTPTGRFIQVETSVINRENTPLTNVNLWVGTRDDWIGIRNSSLSDPSDGPQSNFDGRYRADLPQKFRGTITDGTFGVLGDASTAGNVLVLESLDGAGLFYSSTPGANTIVAPCCETLEAFAAASSSSPGTNTGSGFQNAVILQPTNSATSTPLDAGMFKPTDPSADFFQNRRTDMRDAGYALYLPIGNIPAGADNGITWFLGGVPHAQKSSLISEVATSAPVVPTVTAGRGQLTVSLTNIPTDQNTIGYSVRLRNDSGEIVDSATVFSLDNSYTFSSPANGTNYQIDVAPISGTQVNPIVGRRSAFSESITPDPPLNTVAPVVSGVVAPGATLSTTLGEWEWAGAALSTTYQWQRDGVDIAGATDESYVIPLGVTSGQFSVLVSRSGNGGTAVTAGSNSVGFDPDARLIVEEDFAIAPTSGWVLTGTAKVENGALQLTPAQTAKAGAAFYDVAQPASAGIDATFRINQKDGTGADGMTFFVKDGDNESTTPGAAGSRLGFSAGGSTSGVSGTLFGVGFDRYGAFIQADRTVSAGTFTCPNLGGTSQQGTNTRTPNNLTLRGPGDGLNGYCKLVEGVATDVTTWQDTERTIRVKYDPDASGSEQIRIWVDDTADSDPPVLASAAPPELLAADTFKFGFTASTGGSTNLHEVLDVRFESVTGIPPLQLRNQQNVTPAVANIPYSFDLEELVQGGIRPVTFSVTQGTLPPGMTINSPLSGTPTTPGLYSFTLGASDSRPGDLRGQVSIPVTLRVDAQQQISFPEVSGTQLARGSINVEAVTTLDALGSPEGLPATYTSSTNAVCTVNEQGTITLLDRGTCTITASQAGGTLDDFEVQSAQDVQRSFVISDPALQSLSLSSGTLQPVFDTARNSYSLSVPNSTSEVSVTASPRFSGSTMVFNGTPLTSGQESAPQSLVVGQNTLNIVVTDGDQQNTVTVTVTRAGATTQPPSRPRPQPGAEPEVTTPVPGALVIPRPAPPTPPATLTPNPTANPGPVIVGGQPPRPANQPTATIGGTPTPVTKAPLGDDGVRVTTGSLDFGIRAPSVGSGAIQSGQGSLPELVVPAGTQTQISGTGVAPGSTVQAFLTLNGTNAVELGRIQADSTGSFSGSAVLATPPGQDPLPIGRQVLQILGVDENGNQTVVNMAITVAQPPPQPEVNRDNQEIPGLQPGQTLATVAGLPTAVDVTPLPEDNQTRIDGDGWSMAIDLSGGSGGVEASQDGSVQLTLVRDQEAAVSGSGFMPFTRADVWLFSTPTLLGTVDIDENGEFNGVVSVDGTVVAAGEHTLQLQGVGEDGYVRAANLGVVVADDPSSSPTATSTESMSMLLWTIGGGVALTLALVAAWWIRRRTKIDLNPTG